MVAPLYDVENGSEGVRAAKDEEEEEVLLRAFFRRCRGGGDNNRSGSAELREIMAGFLESPGIIVPWTSSKSGQARGTFPGTGSEPFPVPACPPYLGESLLCKRGFGPGCVT